MEVQINESQYCYRNMKAIGDFHCVEVDEGCDDKDCKEE